MGQGISDQYVITSVESWLSREHPLSATLDIPELGIAVGTSIGQVRNENEDRAIVARLHNVSGLLPTTIFAVCDGLGGMVDGAQCAEKTLAVLLDSFIQSSSGNIIDRLRASIFAANKEIFNKYRQRGGTTLAILCRTKDSCLAATVGDTRVYSFKPGSELKQISIDDTIAGELNKTGIQRDHTTDLFANQLAQFVGIGQELEPRFYELPLTADVSYCIASDGAYNIGSAFEPILANATSPLAAVKRIISVSLWMGGKDNATVVFIGMGHKEPRFGFQEPLIELWSAGGKLEMILPCTPKLVGTTPAVSTFPKDTVLAKPQSNSRNNFSHKSRRTKAKTRQSRSEPNNLDSTRPALEIDFGSTVDAQIPAKES